MISEIQLKKGQIYRQVFFYIKCSDSFMQPLGGMYILAREAILSKSFCLPCQWGHTLKEKKYGNS